MSFVVIVVYVQSGAGLADYEALFEFLEQTESLYNTDVVILGDFNISNYSLTVGSDCPGDVKCAVLRGFLDFFNFRQFNTVHNSHGRLLDLVIASFQCLVVGDVDPLVAEDSHHPTLSVTFNIRPSCNNVTAFTPSAKTYNFRKANLPGLYCAFSAVDWSFLDGFCNVDDACRSFYDFLYSLFDIFVPAVTLKPAARQYPIWFNKHIIKKINNKNLVFRKYRRTQSQYYLDKFRNLRREVRTDIRDAYNSYLSMIQSQIRCNPRCFWSFVNDRRKSSRIPSRLSHEGLILDSPQRCVDGFAEYFASVYVSNPEAGSYRPDINRNDVTPRFVPFDISVDEVLLAAKRVKATFTGGPDKVPGFIVRDCARVFSTPLTKIMNLALRTESFPKAWKIGRVCPIYKKGDSSLVCNYRPISILSNFSKIFESILYTHIYAGISDLFSARQHGFMAKRSTTTNLVNFTQYVAESLDAGLQVDTVFTDFSKAFDQIDHSIILTKLGRMGVPISLVNLISSYLESRAQFVEYLGYRSRVFEPSSGVPQGSNLGPLLFNVFINDICEQFSVEYLLYADDLKMFLRIESVEDAAAVQSNLDGLSEWCTANRLHLNIDKCRVLTFSRKSSDIIFNYTIDSNRLTRCTSFKDLGVTFDRSLKFDLHVGCITSSAMRSLGFIIRSCSGFDDIGCLKLLYFSYVRSHLEYASVVWSPFYAKYSNALESVQRKFLKFLYRKIEGRYPERGIANSLLWNKFALHSLELRRSVSLVKFLHRSLHGELDSQIVANLNFYSSPYPVRAGNLIYLPRPRTNMMLGSPQYSMCMLYNVLARHLDVETVPLTEIVRFCSDNFNMFLN